ncbi:MAG TPA: RecQ family ATP-dependent DNA helicase [Acidimicrobiia bacterium]|nr:RecQ family ATP-dependent DNA helicase [Acidimicrobiia bacterium]
MSRQRSQVVRVAREQLGLEELRPGQREAATAVVEGRDSLVVMPTGWGKSAIYQMAAVMIDGPTVVVSPLLALQKDQVEALEDKHAGEAAALNSTQTESERNGVLEKADEGELEFLFLAPEQLANEEVRREISSTEPSLVVVDEAHCISEWGHDFRPDYLRLGPMIDALGSPRPIILALTATASPMVREEITSRLRMRDPHITVLSFDRPNVSLSVEIFTEEEPKRDALVERVAAADPPGIIYVATRRAAEEIAEELAGRGIAARAYHAGMADGARETAQDAFMAGECDVVVATVAFGLGIDKADVRFVYHLDVPASLDAYYQEMGRGGRDGEAAEARLFFRAEDMAEQHFRGARPRLGEEDVAAVLSILESNNVVGWEELVAASELSAAKAGLVVVRLEEEGMVHVTADSVELVASGPQRLRGALEGVVERTESDARVERTRRDMLAGYAMTVDCRREYLLNYFGEAYEAPCGNCDNCLAGQVEEEDGEPPYPLGSKVVHSLWGEGVVHRYETDVITVLFDSEGYRTLSLELVEQGGLLEPAPGG